MDYTTEYTSPIGKILLASNGTAITGLWFLGQNHFGSTLRSPALDGTSLPVLQQAIQWLDDYWRGTNPSPASLPIQLQGTVFQQNIWKLLLEIPYGTTITYGELARQYALEAGMEAMSARAVGNAVGKNPISIIIPCHRVVGSSGRITGYAGGIVRKSALLQHENKSIPTAPSLTF